jgi:sugar (pentulose or hexulose) kinase
MRSAVLGLDLGTTEAKAGLFDLDGTLLGIERAGYPTVTGPDGRAEQDPRAWWAALEAAAGRLMGTVRARPRDVDGLRVEAICGVAQGPTLVALDAAADPVWPAVTWQDRRVGDGSFGLLPRLAWLAREDPDAARRATWLMPAWDALGLWLSGTAATSLQRHEGMIDVEALEEAGIDTRRMPPAIGVGQRLGGLRSEVADRLGLERGTPVVAGVNDGSASMLGAGLVQPGDAVDTGGASGGFGVYTDRRMEIAGTFSAPAPIEGRWWVGGAMAATGAAVDWLAGPVLGGRWTLDELLAEAAEVPAGSDDLVFLPYLAGERAPIFDEAARGAFVGLTLAHERRHLVRAVLEGAAYAIRHVAAPILDAGVVVTEMRLAGGPSRSDLWARIKADVTGFRVAIPSVADTAVLGAAILAARGVGLAPDLATGVRRMTRVDRTIDPDPAAHRRYSALFDVYRSLYPSLAPTLAGLALMDAARESDEAIRSA